MAHQAETSHRLSAIRPKSWAPVVIGIAALASVVAALWLRAWLLAHDPIISDDAVVGLMADAILKGHPTAFYWGQEYGGSAQAFLAAGAFSVFGHSVYVLTLCAAILQLIAAVLIWRLGIRVFGRPGVAAVAAVVAFAWPLADIVNSTRDGAFRGIVEICGLAVLLLVYRAVTTGGWLAWAGLGAFAGLGWWESPEIGYFLIPAAVLLIWGVVTQRRPRLIEVAAGVICAVIACTPWLVANIKSGMASLQLGAWNSSTYGQRLHLFFTGMVPMLLDLRHVGGTWAVPKAAAILVYIVVAVIVSVAAVAIVRKGPPGAWALVLFLVVFPFFYAAEFPTYFWEDGRYGVYLPAMLALVVVEGWAIVLRSDLLRTDALRARVTAGAAVALLAAVTVPTILEASVVAPDQGSVTSLSPVAEHVGVTIGLALERDHLTHIVSSYWMAYDLDFFAPALTVTPPAEGGSVVRDDSVYNTVARAKHVAWLFVGRTPADVTEAIDGFWSATNPATLTLPRFTTLLTTHHVRYREVRVGPMVAVVPQDVTGGTVLGLLS
jgi:4-amino-4-deoxy-L-arabinose transferase-like glycosyltransferase